MNGGYGAASLEEVVASGAADLVSYGVPFLPNPDLPEQFRRDAALNAADTSTFDATQRVDAVGYTDYPTLG